VQGGARGPEETYTRGRGTEYTLAMQGDSCGVCGGDGRVSSTMGGSSTVCPSCRGNGRRPDLVGFYDVTKTKPSHHRGTNKVEGAVKQTWPVTHAGRLLAEEVKSSGLSDVDKSRLTHEIMEYEETHATCTKTFTKKVRKQLGPS